MTATESPENKDTYWVRLILNNDYDLYQEFMRIVKLAKWDEDEARWTRVEHSVQVLRELVQELDPDQPGFSDLRKVDFVKVDYAGIVQDELDELDRSR